MKETKATCVDTMLHCFQVMCTRSPNGICSYCFHWVNAIHKTNSWRQDVISERERCETRRRHLNSLCKLFLLFHAHNERRDDVECVENALQRRGVLDQRQLTVSSPFPKSRELISHSFLMSLMSSSIGSSHEHSLMSCSEKYTILLGCNTTNTVPFGREQ